MMLGTLSAMTDQLSKALHTALSRTGEGQTTDGIAEAALRWEIPKDPSFGDLSNSVSFKVAARRKQPPQRIAETLSQEFLACCRQAGLAVSIERVEAKGGFLNVFLSQQALVQVLHDSPTGAPLRDAPSDERPVGQY